MRFLPDTWLEVLLRPVAMAAPDANIYVEIMAPDFRFVFVLALLMLLGAIHLRRGRGAGLAVARIAGGRDRSYALVVLTLALAVAFVPWIATTGNGRYFVVGLLVVGPVVVGLTAMLPVTRSLRLTLAVGMLALQAFAVQQSSPWRAWTLATWREPPYFQMDIPPQSRAQPATYVTLSAITYSLLAPQFHPQSRWISLHSAPTPDSGTPDGRRTEAFLAKAQAGRLMLLVPVVPGTLTGERLPNARVSEVINGQLALYRLGLTQPQSCQFLHSRGLAGMGLVEKTKEERARSGFWLCHLTRLDAGAPVKTARGKRYDAVFKKLEAQCPRYFPAGGDAGSLALANGEVRSYMQAEMKAYVYDSGEVYYKYYRALNPVLVGKMDDLLAGRSQLDCGKIRGRSGLPWEREI